MRPRRLVCFALFAMLLPYGRVFAQVDTGWILGTVRDQTGAVIPNASVTVTNKDTNASFKASAKADGSYEFATVKPGNYKVVAQAPGFGAVTQENAVLNVQQRLVVDFTLRPGSITQNIEVTAAPPQLQTQDASLGAVVGTRTINDLPLNGRNYTFLAQLNAGVTVAQQDTRGLGSSGTFAANGTRPDQNNYLLDGIDNNSNLTDFLNGNSYIYRPSVDALQEFKVQTSNFSAEFGRSAGAVLNATIKSGTDQFHGAAWEFFRNDALDAANFFENANAQPKGKFRQNQFGVDAGGPVILPHLYNGKDKTFLFLDYEGIRIRQATPYVSSVPTALERSSGFTNLSDLTAGQSGTRTDLLGRTFPLGQVFDPASTRTVTAGQVDPATGLVAKQTGFVRDPFSGNIVPTLRLNPNAIKLLSVYPSPNRPGLFNNYISDPTYQDQVDQGDVRIDQVFNEKNQIFGRASISKDSAYIPPPFTGLANGGGFNTGTQTNNTYNDVGSWTHEFSPAFVNEARAGYSKVDTTRLQPFANDLSNIPAQFGIQGVPQVSQNGGLPTYNITGLSQLGATPWSPTHETNDTVQITDNVTKIAGAHTFKAGFEFRRVNITFFQPAYPRGSFTYSGVYTEVANTSGGNTGLAQVLLSPVAADVSGGYNNVGGADTVNATNLANPPPAETRHYYAGYFQDDWKLTSKLTLNLGLRYDFFGHGVAPDGRQANALLTSSNSALYLMTKQQCNQGLSPSFLSLTAKDNISIGCSGNPVLLESDKTNFAPRIGVAYSFTPRFVVRSGFGIFYGTTINGDNLVDAINYPYSYGVAFNYPDTAHPITYPNGSIASLETGLVPLPLANAAAVNAQGLGLTGTEYDFHTPYSMEYNFTLQYQVSQNQTFSMGYVGTQGRHLQVHVGANSVTQILPTGLNAQKYVAFPDFSRNGLTQNVVWGNSQYNGFQTSFERRFSQGLQLLANYSWSKCRTDARDILNNNAGGYRAAFLPGFGIQGDYALCDYDVTHVVHLSGVYTLPVGRGQKFFSSASGLTNQLVGGWRINSVATLETGQPFTIGCPTPTTTGLGCYALLVPGQNIYAGSHNVNQWMNPAAFAEPPAATAIGQSSYAPLGGAPTQVFGPGYHRMDLSIFKEFPIHEQAHLEFRTEIFNLTNTPQFSIPGFSGPGIAAAPGATDFTNTANFGKITSTRDGAYDQREIQFALKLYW